MRRLGVLGAGLILLLLAGCKKDEADAKKAEAATPAAPQWTASSPVRKLNILSSGVGPALLPPETLAVIAVEGMTALSERLGLEAVKTRFPKAWEGATKEPTRELGVNPLDPASLRAAGFHPDAPMGAALIGHDPMAAAFWIGSSDMKKAEAWATAALKIAGVEAPIRTTEGQRVLLSGGLKQPTFLFTKTVVMIFVSEKDPTPLARAAAKREAKASLAESAAFKAAIKDLPRGQSVGVYSAVADMVGPVLGMAAGLADSLVGGKGVLSGGGDDTGPAGVMALRWRAEGQAQLLAPLRTLDRPHAILKVTKRSPLLLVGGAVEIAKVSKTLEVAAQLLMGMDSKVIAEGLKKELGLDLEKDVLGVLTGELGFSMAIERNPDLEKDKDSDFLEEQAHGHLVVGVTDDKKAADTLALVGKLLGWEQDSGRFRTKVPGWRTVTVGVADGYIIASTETSAFERIKADGSAADSIQNPQLKALAGTSGYAGIGMLDLRLIGWLLYATSMEGRMGTDDPEIKKLNEEIGRRASQLETKIQLGATGVMEAFGVVAGTLTPADGGLDASLGLYYGKKNAAEVVAVAADLVEKRRTVWKEEGRAIDKLRETLRLKLNAMVDDGEAPQVPPKAAGRTLTGTLKYEPLPATKSVRAYNGVEFTLDLGSEAVPLAAGAITRETLVANKNKKVTVVCTMGTPQLPNPQEAHPVGPDGAPVARPAKCAVTSLTPAP